MTKSRAKYYASRLGTLYKKLADEVDKGNKRKGAMKGAELSRLTYFNEAKRMLGGTVNIFEVMSGMKSKIISEDGLTITLDNGKIELLREAVSYAIKSKRFDTPKLREIKRTLGK